MTNVIAETHVANSLLWQLGMRFLAREPYPLIPEVVDLGPAELETVAGTCRFVGDAGAFRVTMVERSLYIEAEGRKAFPLLHSVEGAEPGRLENLDRAMDRIISANRKGDFTPLFKAYGGQVPRDRLKARWAEAVKELEEGRGRIIRHEVLGSARTQDREETVVRFHCERGASDWTYVWDVKAEGRLLGRSVRGLAVRLRLYPSGQGAFFTWVGGLRPPKIIRIEKGEGGRFLLRIGRGPTPIKKGHITSFLLVKLSDVSLNLPLSHFRATVFVLNPPLRES